MWETPNTPLKESQDENDGDYGVENSKEKHDKNDADLQYSKMAETVEKHEFNIDNIKADLSVSPKESKPSRDAFEKLVEKAMIVFFTFFVERKLPDIFIVRYSFLSIVHLLLTGCFLRYVKSSGRQ